MEGDTVHFTLGNVSQSGLKMRQEWYAEAQEANKQRFISFLKRGIPRLKVSSEVLMNDGYRISVTYGSSPVDISFRDSVRIEWKRVRIVTCGETDEFFLPFCQARKKTRMWDAGIVAGLIFIMMGCVYMEVLNKPDRYWLLSP